MVALAGGFAETEPALGTEQLRLFRELYCDHFDFVFRNLRRLGVADSAAEDALQEVYLVVLRHIDSYRPGTHPRAWLFAIAYRVASTYRRTMRRRRDRAVAEVDDFCSPEAGPLNRVMVQHARSVLHGFLDGLPDSQRSVFIMVELEQMTAPEIAQALDVNLNTVYARLRVARRKFAEMVRERHAASSGDQ